MNLIVLNTGVITKCGNNSGNIKVHNPRLKRNSIFNLTLEQYANIKNKNIGSINVPENKLTFNNWIDKVWNHKTQV